MCFHIDMSHTKGGLAGSHSKKVHMPKVQSQLPYASNMYTPSGQLANTLYSLEELVVNTKKLELITLDSIYK